jgi:hypothetical protein
MQTLAGQFALAKPTQEAVLHVIGEKLNLCFAKEKMAFFVSWRKMAKNRGDFPQKKITICYTEIFVRICDHLKNKACFGTRFHRFGSPFFSSPGRVPFHFSTMPNDFRRSSVNERRM